MLMKRVRAMCVSDLIVILGKGVAEVLGVSVKTGSSYSRPYLLFVCSANPPPVLVIHISWASFQHHESLMVNNTSLQNVWRYALSWVVVRLY